MLKNDLFCLIAVKNIRHTKTTKTYRYNLVMFAILLEKISLHHSIIFFQYMIFFQYVEVNFSSINQLTDPLLFFFYSLIT